MESNGYSSVGRLREQLRETRVSRAVVKAQIEENALRRQLLQESWKTGFPYAWWLPLDFPTSAFDPLSAPGPWLPAGGYRGSRKGGAHWRVLSTETAMDLQRAMARILADGNPVR